MPRKRAQPAPLALALDGSLLLNSGGQLAPALVAQVARALSIRTADLFIAARLSPAQYRETFSRLDDAAAEAAARIGALPGAKTTTRRKKQTPKKHRPSR